MQRVDDRETILKRLDKLCSYDDSAVVLDLIYGFPGQTMEIWEDDLKTAASLPLDGIDCYQLNVFEKSPLARYIANGKLPAAAGQAQKADMFARSVEYLTDQNWRRLSNNHWANSTRERNIYIAFGCGAGGRLFGNAFMMERKLADYYAILEKGEKPAAFLMAPKPNWHLLRTISADMDSGSISLAKISRAFGNVDLEGMAAPLLKQWAEAGLLVKKGEWYYQTVAGQYWHVTRAAPHELARTHAPGRRARRHADGHGLARRDEANGQRPGHARVARRHDLPHSLGGSRHGPHDAAPDAHLGA